MTHTDMEKLQLSGTIVFGEGHLMFAREELVAFYYPTEDGRHHVFDVYGRRLGDFATKENAMNFVSRRWSPDGSLSQ